MATDTTTLQIRIAVLETQLQHAHQEKAASLASAQQTISVLTAIILSLGLNQTPIQNGNQNKTQDQSDVVRLATNTNENEKAFNLQNQILQLQRQSKLARNGNTTLEEQSRSTVHRKTENIAKSCFDHEATLTHQQHGQTSGHVSGSDETGANIEIGRGGKPIRVRRGIYTHEESFGSLIGDEFTSNVLGYTESSEPVNCKEIESMALESDFQSLEDLLGPETGASNNENRQLGRESAPPRYGYERRRISPRNTKRNLSHLAPVELQYGDDIDATTLKTKTEKKSDLTSSSQDKMIDTAVPAVVLVGPKSTVLKTEESVERCFAGGTYEYTPHRDTMGDSERGADNLQFRSSRRFVKYSDIDYAPLPRSGAVVARRQRALEPYDFTPCGIPEFGVAIPPVTVSVSATSASATTLFHGSDSLFRDNSPLDKTLYTSLEERRAAIAIHTSQSRPGDRTIPKYFHYGLNYKPTHPESNHLCTVHVGNLPTTITLRALLGCVRGGAVLSAILCDTVKLTGGMSALIVFLTEIAAGEYAAFANKHSLYLPLSINKNKLNEQENQRVVFTVLNTPTWPMNEPGIISGLTRVVRISNLPARFSIAEIKYRLGCQAVLVDLNVGEDGEAILEFSSVRAAGKAYETLKSSREFAGFGVGFEEDPCGRPLSDLVDQSGGKRWFNEDVIVVDLDEEEEIDQDKSKQVVEVKRKKSDNLTIGESTLDWANEMNELAAEINDTIDICAAGIVNRGDRVVSKGQLQKPTGLAGNRYSTLVPGY